MSAFMRQFHGQPCAICGSREGTAGHHLLPKGSHADYAFEEMNILPLCPTHHMFSNEIAAHSTSSMVIESFIEWLKENRPEKYAWMKDHRFKRSGKRKNFRDIYKSLDRKSSDVMQETCSTSVDFTDLFAKMGSSSSPTNSTSKT